MLFALYISRGNYTYTSSLGTGERELLRGLVGALAVCLHLHIGHNAYGIHKQRNSDKPAHISLLETDPLAHRLSEGTIDPTHLRNDTSGSDDQGETLVDCKGSFQLDVAHACVKYELGGFRSILRRCTGSPELSPFV